MCGVFGYVGKRGCVQDIFKGLSVLEYRGYDSAGISVLFDREIHLAKSEGKLSHLEPLLDKLPSGATVGMGHTRWATHGAPTTVNAHPHVYEGIALIHNGIIENYDEIRSNLKMQGLTFTSATDSEVALKLIAFRMKEENLTLHAALMRALEEIRGSFAFALMSVHEPHAIYLAKQGSPIAIGIGDGENFFASDALSLVSYTKKALFLQDGEIALITPDTVKITNFEGEVIKRFPTQLQWSETSIEKRGFKHFMLKEIHDQPGMVAAAIKRYVNQEQRKLNAGVFPLDQLDTAKIRSVQLIACGTAYYAANVARYFLEASLGMPCQVELAHEFRYRQALVDEHTLLVAVSQSGETADTLASVVYAKARGAQTLAVCNVQHSSIPRECQAQLYMEAGPEIGVASTKAFTSMILNMYLFGLALAESRSPKKEFFSQEIYQELMALPIKLEQAIDSFDSIDQLAYKYHKSLSCLFIGRGMSFPLACEGALKLKEISYIHAEGFAGGELKHGPIALVDPQMAIIALAPRDSYYEKMLSNVEEVAARHGRVVGIGSLNDSRLHEVCNDYIACPNSTVAALNSIIMAIPLQIFAYCAAVHRGTDVDQPRNLAKSVTVE